MSVSLLLGLCELTMKNKQTFQYDYPRPAVTADCVIFGFDARELKILLIERAVEPFQGRWSLPGGFVAMDETADACAARVLKKETNLEQVFMEQLYTFSDVERDPRYRVISIAYFSLVKLADYHAVAGADATRLKWFGLGERPELAFDHVAIIEKALERLKGKIKYQPVGFELLPEKFTLPDLRNLYEVILQTPLDDRNFRKKILSYSLLVDTGEMKRGAKNRAPKLYRFDKQKYEELTRNGFYFEL